MKSGRVLFLGLMLVGLSACQRNPPPENTVIALPHSHGPSFVTLGATLQSLKDDFNSHADSVRLIYIVGPTCPECLHGMDVLGKAVRTEQDDPRVRTYVVYVPALGATAKDIQPTVGLIPGNYVNRYWDPHGATGNDFNEVLGIHQFAWDVYMIYEPGQLWNAGLPPKPRFWMDQLSGLSGNRHLNADVFARHVKDALMPTATGPSSRHGF